MPNAVGSSLLAVFLYIQSAYFVLGITTREFYPFGARIQHVVPAQSRVSDPVQLRTSYSFYGQYYRTLRVHRDGAISLGSDPGRSLRHRKFPFPPELHVIAPFYAPAVIGEEGQLLYGEAVDAGVLGRATQDVRSVFIDEQAFNASAVFVVTWDRVKHAHHEQDGKNNTFQAVLITDGENTFVLFNYAKHGLQWTKGYHVRWRDSRKYHGQAGFSAGDGIRVYTLPWSGSLKVRHLATSSNMNSDGQWMYKVGWPSMNHLGVQPADSYEEEYVSNYFFVEQYYKGCYQVHGYVDISNRTHIWTNITIRSCMILCFERRSDYIALHNGTQCACLRSVKHLVRARNEAECGVRCVANNDELCGGEYVMSVYETTAHASVMSDESSRSRQRNDFDECSRGTAQCHDNASCINKYPGFCCECDKGFYGNGISCVKKGAVQRMVGYMSGDINGLTIKSLFVDTIGYTNDGRAYVALQGLPPSLAHAMRILTPLTTTAGWMFGLPKDGGNSNGFGIVGDLFTRNSTVSFDTGEVLSIYQKFKGKYYNNHHVSITTIIRGTIPPVPPGARINMPKFEEEYARTGRGIIESRGRVKYEVNGVGNEFLMEQVIHYNEPRACVPEVTSLVLEVDVLMTRYDASRSFLGIAIRGRLRNGSGDDVTDVQRLELTFKPRLCGTRLCHQLADCITYRGRGRCRCIRGYRGDGVTYCRSSNPQERPKPTSRARVSESCGGVTCHRLAKCIPYRGRERCRCNRGYRGDGVNYCRFQRRGRPTTRPELAGKECGAQICHLHGVCITYRGRKECRCYYGYRGDGVTSCTSLGGHDKPTSRPLSTGPKCDGQTCHRHGVCITYRGRHECRCNYGYRGDGVKFCLEIQNPGIAKPTSRPALVGQKCGEITCHREAECITYRGRERCRCNRGYRGDGVTYCKTLGGRDKPTSRPDPKDPKCNGQTCHRHGVCITYRGRQECRCNYGYRGDGVTYCLKIQQDAINEPTSRLPPAGPGCGQVTCHPLAKCITYRGRERCRCNRGYRGDGVNYCRRLDQYEREKPTSGPKSETCGSQTCHRYGVCITYRGRQECRCNHGYRGDGVTYCLSIQHGNDKPTSPKPTGKVCGSQNCHRFAECVTYRGQERCRCNRGYRGDGVTYCTYLDQQERVKPTTRPAPQTCGAQTCHRHGVCIIYRGRQECRCNHGYRGDGVTYCHEFRQPTGRPKPNSERCGVQICHRLAQCKNYRGRERCICNRGYRGDGIVYCASLNQQVTEKPTSGPGPVEQRCGDATCHPKAECITYQGRERCRCNRGYRGDGVNYCRTLDQSGGDKTGSVRCGERTCHRHGVCITYRGRQECRCNHGYRGDGVTYCTMVPTEVTRPPTRRPTTGNPQLCGGRTCHRYGVCITYRGRRECRCNRGYQGDGVTYCNVIPDRRTTTRQPTWRPTTGDGKPVQCGGETCHRHGVCITYRGRRECRCNHGYRGDGVTFCNSIDGKNPTTTGIPTAKPTTSNSGGVQCGQVTCHRLGVCITYRGKLECRCNYGYRGDGLTYCNDVDECKLNRHRCDANAECVNTIGSYICKCKSGYTGDGNTCKEAKDFQCSQSCDKNAKCVRLSSSTICVCLPGYQGNGLKCTPDGTCEGIKCHANAQCLQAVDGSQRCVCSAGHVGDGRTCTKLGPCGGATCSDNAQCIQSRCVCKTGYQGNGQQCKDANECELKTHRCHTNADCINTVGSYRCKCKSEYTGDGFRCTKVAVEGSCNGKKCHPNAECFSYRGQKQCVCERGYLGNGEDCKDVNECEGNNECDPLKAVCTNTLGSYSCTCKPGYGGDGRTCTPLSPCGGEVCHRFGECMADANTGKKQCRCQLGFRGNGIECEDMDECLPILKTCDANALCRNTLGSFECLCRRGFTQKEGKCISTSDGSCNGRGTCSPDARCDPILGCTCKTGYDGDGYNCTDTNECKPGKNRCDPNAECRNTVGSFQCVCKSGFIGDGFRCTSDGTCAGITCDVNARCDDRSNGTSQRCVCDSGWTGNGQACADIDECKTVQCPVNADCINTVGAYECRCRLGFSKNGSECQVDTTCGGAECDKNAKCLQHSNGKRECVCNKGWVMDAGRTCVDIDECRTVARTCSLNADCTNTPGSYSCRCRPGFAGDGQLCEADGTCAGVTCHPDASCHRNTAHGTRCVCNPGYLGDGRKCTDIDECAKGEHNCSKNALCTNTDGSFTCKCLLGYIGDGMFCKADGTCQGVKCDPNAKCVAASPTGENRTCACNDGFSGDGLFCRDLDECALGHANCHRKAKCFNTLGSFECRCVVGYVGNGIDCKSDGTCEGNVCDFNGECVAKNTSEGITERVCQCNAGFQGDGIICTDLDECLKGPCPANSKCINNFGSYLCLCNPGYKKRNGKCEKLCRRCLNGGSCVGDNGCACNKGFSGKQCQWYGDASLVFTKGNSVQRMSLPPRPSAIGLLFQNDGMVNVGIDYDCVEEYIYWSEIMEGCIMRAKYDGTDRQVVIPRKQVKSPEGLAVDWLGRNLYWTDTGLDVIEVSNLNGSNRRVLISNALDDPRAIVVDPPNGKMYWSDWTRRKPRIEVANMDGSGRRVLIYEKLGLPNGLTLVKSTNELCYTDAGTWSIRCIDLGGLNVRKVLYPAPYPFGIASFNRTLFWTDWMNNKVQRIGVDAKSPDTPLRTYVGRNGKIFDVKAVQPCPARVPKTPCSVNNGGCQGLCLLRPNGYTCSCPKDTFLVQNQNGSQCVGKCNDPLGVEKGLIADSHITASSAWDNNHKRYGAHRARLNLNSWPAGWNAKRFDPDPWLQFDLGSVKTVTGLATQGLGQSNYNEWVKTYKVSSSSDGEKWFVYQDGVNDKVFMGNSDRSTVKRNNLMPPLKTRWLRIHPRTWMNSIAMRVELYGC